MLWIYLHNYLITKKQKFNMKGKLIKEYPELEGTNNLCNDIIQKRTGKMTEEEWQAAERAQTETKHENCCTPIGQIKRYVDCIGCDKNPKQQTPEEAAKEYIIKKYQQGTYLGKLFIAGAKWQQEQTISDEEIERLLKERWGLSEEFIAACKWYREQYKNK